MNDKLSNSDSPSDAKADHWILVVVKFILWLPVILCLALASLLVGALSASKPDSDSEPDESRSTRHPLFNARILGDLARTTKPDSEPDEGSRKCHVCNGRGGWNCDDAGWRDRCPSCDGYGGSGPGYSKYLMSHRWDTRPKGPNK